MNRAVVIFIGSLLAASTAFATTYVRTEKDGTTDTLYDIDDLVVTLNSLATDKPPNGALEQTRDE